MHIEIARALLRFIEKSPSTFHAVENLKEMLEAAGFHELREEQRWTLEAGQGYFVRRNGASLIAFRYPGEGFEGYQLAAGHIDFPCLKVKPHFETSPQGCYTGLNVEIYGSAIQSTWLDRPLSVAGRLVLRGENGVERVLVDVDRELLLIPNVAIHMNRQINDGLVLNPQIDLQPIIGSELAKGRFLEVLAEAAGVAVEDILDFDLTVYNRTPGVIWGADNEFISSRALDDMQCSYTIFRSLTESSVNPKKVTVACAFDNEEVGSLSKHGADSTFMLDVLLRINDCAGRGHQDSRVAFANSFMVSADNAHAFHPNHPEKADPTHRPLMNGGPVLKYHTRQNYTTDGLTGGIFRSVCEKAGVPLQSFSNRSDSRGGTTLGNLCNRHVSINAVDIGLPQLAMHSSYETAGVKDTEYLHQLMKTYFETAIRTNGEGSYSLE